MTSMANLRTGHELPSITLPRLNGGKLSFAELQGKRVLLFFWGSW